MLTFLEHQKVTFKLASLGTYNTSLRHFHAFLIKTFQTNKIYKRHVAQLTKTHIQNYLLYLNQKQLAPYSRVNYLLIVKKYLAWEIDQKTINVVLDHLGNRTNRRGNGRHARGHAFNNG